VASARRHVTTTFATSVDPPPSSAGLPTQRRQRISPLSAASIADRRAAANHQQYGRGAAFLLQSDARPTGLGPAAHDRVRTAAATGGTERRGGQLRFAAAAMVDNAMGELRKVLREPAAYVSRTISSRKTGSTPIGARTTSGCWPSSTGTTPTASSLSITGSAAKSGATTALKSVPRISSARRSMPWWSQSNRRDSRHRRLHQLGDLALGLCPTRLLSSVDLWGRTAAWPRFESVRPAARRCG
jgi:hypothetical protein